MKTAEGREGRVCCYYLREGKLGLGGMGWDKENRTRVIEEQDLILETAAG